MKTVFLDTNIFLHYKSFDQIDWQNICECSVVRIIIPPITIRELNKQKELHQHKHIRERASKILKKLNTLLGTNNPSSFGKEKELFLEDREPIIAYSEAALHVEVQDDSLIASILFHHKDNPDSDIILITSDDGLLLKAKAKRYNINTASLSDEYKLPIEYDAQQKHIKGLEEELLHLKSSTPDLSLTFEDGNDFISCSITDSIVLPQDFIEKQMADLKQKNPRMNKQQPPKINNPADLMSLPMTFAQMFQAIPTNIPDKDVDNYNKQLDEYFNNYQKFLKDDVQYQNMQQRAIEIKLFLSNDGTTPAEDIDVFLHFPNGFTLYKQGDFPRQPQAPKPPDRPKPEIYKLLDRPYLNDLIMTPRLSHFPKPPLPPSNVSPLRIKPSKSYDVDFHVIRLKHNLRESISALSIVFDSYDSAKSFNVQYQILAGNLPHPVKQDLHIIVEKKPS